MTDRLFPELLERAARFRARAGRPPKLVVVLVGDDPASRIYVSRKARAAEGLGFAHETLAFPADASPATVRSAISAMNRDAAIDGILIQRPLPSVFVEEELCAWVTPEKDVDCFHPENAGLLYLDRPRFLPCTPAGILRLLDHHGVGLSGLNVCVVGRSTIVGKPMAQLLLSRDATVTHCHSRTRDLRGITKASDLVVVAAGNPRFLGADAFKRGAIVVDVGIHRLDDGKIVGDVDFAPVSGIVSAITPVPGGVGPMTIAMLLENTLSSAERTA